MAGASAAPVFGLQLWSLRDEFKNDAMRAMELTHDMGFTEVEAAGTAGMAAEAFRDALAAHGLHATSAHIGYGDLEKDLDSVISDVKTLGATHAFCPWIPHEGVLDLATVEKAAANFNKWGAAFHAAGIQFGYHTHGYEFVPGTQGGTLFDDLVRLTDPENVKFQMDVFWVYHSAVDPLALLKKYPDRWVSLHVKDIRKGAPVEAGSSGAPATDKVPVGMGALDWPALLETARAQGITHLVIEDESDDPLTNIPISMKYLKHLPY